MFFDRRRLKKHTKILFVLFIFLIATSLIITSIGGIVGGSAPTIDNADQNQGMTQEEVMHFFQEQISMLEEAVEENPEDVQAISELAELYMMMGEGEKAVEKYLALTEIQPDNVEARLNLSSLYYSVGDYDQAEEEIVSVLEKDEANNDARLYLVSLYHAIGNFEQAEDQVKIVLEQDEDNLDARYMYSIVLAYGKEDYQAAITQMEKFIELAGDDLDVEQANQIIEEWQSQI